jgi:hypothetical protein
VFAQYCRIFYNIAGKHEKKIAFKVTDKLLKTGKQKEQLSNIANFHKTA